MFIKHFVHKQEVYKMLHYLMIILSKFIIVS